MNGNENSVELKLELEYSAVWKSEGVQESGSHSVSLDRLTNH